MKDIGEVDEEKIIAEQLEMPKLKKETSKPKKTAKKLEDPAISQIVTSLQASEAEKSSRAPIIQATDRPDAPDPQPKPTKRPLNRLLVATAVIIALLFGWIIYIYFQNGSLATYSVGGLAVNLKTSEAEINQKLNPKLQNYQFTIDSPARKSTHKASELGLTVNAKKTLESVSSARKNNSLFANLAWWQTHTLPLEMNIDEAKVSDFVNAKLIVATTPPVNATLATEDGEIAVTEEQAGKGFTVDNPRQPLIESIKYLKPSQTITLKEQTITAKISRSSLEPVIREINSVAQTSIKLDIEGELVVVDPETIISWVDPVQTIDTKARLEINSGKVQRWLDEVTTGRASNVRDEVRTKNPDGTERVLVNGRNSYKLSNDAQIAKDIVAHLEKRTAYSKSLSATIQHYKVVYVNTYDKWLLADLSNHMMYAYEQDRLVNSFPMSAGAPETPTVVGQFAIYQKYRSQTMRGPNTDGTSYSVPNVEWVSYFHEAYAIHGNYWRPASTFGSLNTSHGCIGMPNASSRWIYEWAPIGTPVITYK